MESGGAAPGKVNYRVGELAPKFLTNQGQGISSAIATKIKPYVYSLEGNVAGFWLSLNIVKSYTSN